MMLHRKNVVENAVLQRSRRALARLLVMAALVLPAAGCRRHHATAAECGAILDRVVDLELHELGYRDPALAARKRTELRTTLAAELHACEGVNLREESMRCIAAASSVEEISHRCLR